MFPKRKSFVDFLGLAIISIKSLSVDYFSKSIPNKFSSCLGFKVISFSKLTSRLMHQVDSALNKEWRNCGTIGIYYCKEQSVWRTKQQNEYFNQAIYKLHHPHLGVIEIFLCPK
jgi:hypothetical protein